MVIAYHGVRRRGEPEASGMHVSAERFASIARSLAAVATFVPLQDLVDRHRGGKGTRGLVAVTFDDAYASVAATALDVIREHSIPVTLFAVSDAASTGEPFWWDRIEQPFAVASPERWRAFEDECGLPDVFRSGQPAAMGRFRPFRQWILSTHRGRWDVALNAPLAKLAADTGCSPSQRPLSFDEMERLLQDPLVDVGPHTLSHPVLPFLSDDEARSEIRGSFDALRARYPKTLPILSFPYGLYDARTVAIARDEGLTACVTLGAKLLNDTIPDGTIPRIGLTARHPPWLAVLCALGWWRGVRPGSRAAHRYPDLPSATT
jgi:peptidoglycan/xylan/chitin deacetylase (PgdA/CDA1 family)